MRYKLCLGVSATANEQQQQAILKRVEERITTDMDAFDFKEAFTEAMKSVVPSCTTVVVTVKERVVEFVVETKELIADIIDSIERWINTKYHQHIRVSGGPA